MELWPFIFPRWRPRWLGLPIERIVKTLIRLSGCQGWSESSLGAHVILLVLLCGGSNVLSHEKMGLKHHTVCDPSNTHVQPLNRANSWHCSWSEASSIVWVNSKGSGETAQAYLSLHFFTWTLSHLSAHVVNLLLRENWKPIPNFFKGKKLFKNVTFQILNFLLIS